MGQKLSKIEFFVNSIVDMGINDPIWIDIYSNGSCKAGRGFKETYEYFVCTDHMLKHMGIDLRDYSPIAA